MKQYQPCIQNDNNNNNNNNNNNIIIIIIIIKLKKIKRKGAERGRREGERGREGILFLFFSSLCFFLRSTKIGPQVFVETEDKVNIRDESYAWTPKSWSFIKLHKVGDFPTCVISSLKAI